MTRMLTAALLAALLLSGCAAHEVNLAHESAAHVCHDDCHGYYSMTPEDYRRATESFELGLLRRD